ncbi:hypothetical protein BDV97DRAFT_349848 [Delphinella strobiligena]|nr:hypothetical protein BDV97DRAFT_349848 [Delphinella strobiligena]
MALPRRPCADPCPHLYCNEQLSTTCRDENAHACLYCSRSFSEVSFLVRHVFSQHPENMYGGSGRNTSMIIKTRLSKKHRCPHCGEVCSKKYILGNHVRAMHTALQASESTEIVPDSTDETESSASESPRRVTPVTPRMRNCTIESTRSNAPSPTDSLIDFNTHTKTDSASTKSGDSELFPDMGHQAVPRSLVLASFVADMKMESEGRL